MTKATRNRQTLTDRVECLERTRHSEGTDFYSRLNKVEDAAQCVKVGHANTTCVAAFSAAAEPSRWDVNYLVTADRRCTLCGAQKEDRFDLRSRKDRKAFLAFLRG